MSKSAHKCPYSDQEGITSNRNILWAAYQRLAMRENGGERQCLTQGITMPAGNKNEVDQEVEDAITHYVDV